MQLVSEVSESVSEPRENRANVCAAKARDGLNTNTKPCAPETDGWGRKGGVKGRQKGGCDKIPLGRRQTNIHAWLTWLAARS